MTNQFIIDILGWVPAVIFPAATLSQLLKLISTKETKGISSLSWLLFGIANTCLYIYTEKYFTIQSIAGLLVTAIADFFIAIYILYLRKYVRNN